MSSVMEICGAISDHLEPRQVALCSQAVTNPGSLIELSSHLLRRAADTSDVEIRNSLERVAMRLWERAVDGEEGSTKFAAFEALA